MASFTADLRLRPRDIVPGDRIRLTYGPGGTKQAYFTVTDVANIRTIRGTAYHIRIDLDGALLAQGYHDFLAVDGKVNVSPNTGRPAYVIYGPQEKARIRREMTDPNKEND